MLMCNNDKITYLTLAHKKLNWNSNRYVVIYNKLVS